MSLDKPPNGNPGTAFTIKLRQPDKQVQEADDLEFHAFFPNTGSVLIFGAKPLIESLLEEHKKQLSFYNGKLTKNRVPIRIRLTHSVKVKGKKYVYCGRFIYGKDDSYFGVLDNVLLRKEHIKEKWNKVGPPPINPLEGFKYQVLVVNGDESDHIIVPYNLYTNHKFTHLFTDYTRYRIMG